MRPGGYEAAVEGARKGMRVALVEDRELSGTCLNPGMYPHKDHPAYSGTIS